MAIAVERVGAPATALIVPHALLTLPIVQAEAMVVRIDR
jgi:hypothetical protein